MSGIIWLASYPKSGNTWFSIFLANLLANSAQPVDINQPLLPANFADRAHFDRLVGWESSELTPAQLTRVRWRAQETWAREGELVINKTHEAFADPQESRPLFSPAATRCVILLVRNPLDIVASLSHHSGTTLDETIAFMNNPRACNAPGGSGTQLPQLLLDWSSHARSWLNATGVAVLTLRYEDLLAAPEENFTRACEFAGLPAERSRVRRAIGHSRFDTLRSQEAQKGFAEAPARRRFFREGRSGSWREVLSTRQVAAIVERHEPIMRHFGYGGARENITSSSG